MHLPLCVVACVCVLFTLKMISLNVLNYFRCTNPSFYGCERTGSTPMLINPIRSAKIRTHDSFSFKYGKVEISAKMPAGDWLNPGTNYFLCFYHFFLFFNHIKTILTFSTNFMIFFFWKSIKSHLVYAKR